MESLWRSLCVAALGLAAFGSNHRAAAQFETPADPPLQTPPETAAEPADVPWVGQPDQLVTPAQYSPQTTLPASVAGTNDRYEQAGRALAEAPSSPAVAGTPAASSLTPRPLSAAQPQGGLTPIRAAQVERARVSKGSGKLPNDDGQVWREYDIRPYTQRSGADEPKPQQRVVDWILRETGYEAWHSETFGILNANRDTLTVYHTPSMQALVADIVDRFVNHTASTQAFSMRILTVRNPDWRARALGMMTPIAVQSAGLQGWVLPKENFALLMSELARRGDVRDYNASNQLVPNGRSSVFSTMRPRGYVQGIVPTQNAWPGYQPQSGQLNEGASLEFTPLMSIDMKSAEAVVKLRLHQVERMRRVSLDLPSPTAAGAGGSQRLQVEVPQLTMANLHERFRWPADQVLLLSMGMVATPGPDQGGTFNSMLPDSMKTPPRADALLFIQAHDARTPAAAGATGGRVSTATRPTPTFNGRY